MLCPFALPSHHVTHPNMPFECGATPPGSIKKVIFTVRASLALRDDVRLLKGEASGFNSDTILQSTAIENAQIGKASGFNSNTIPLTNCKNWCQ